VKRKVVGESIVY